MCHNKTFNVIYILRPDIVGNLIVAAEAFREYIVDETHKRSGNTAFVFDIFDGLGLGPTVVGNAPTRLGRCMSMVVLAHHGSSTYIQTHILH